MALWIVNTYSKFQVNNFSYKKRYYKKSKFKHDNDDKDNAKAVAIPQVFSNNCRAKIKNCTPNPMLWALITFVSFTRFK